MKKLIAVVLGTEVAEAGIDCSHLKRTQFRCRNGVYQYRTISYSGRNCERQYISPWWDEREC